MTFPVFAKLIFAQLNKISPNNYSLKVAVVVFFINVVVFLFSWSLTNSIYHKVRIS